MSKLWEFGCGVTYLREEGYVSVCITSCNGECYIVTFSAHLVKCLKILQRVDRGFLSSIGLEVFRVKTLCPLFLSAEVLLLDVPRTGCPNKAYSVFARKFRKFLEHNSSPLVFRTLVSNRPIRIIFYMINPRLNRLMSSWYGTVKCHFEQVH